MASCVAAAAEGEVGARLVALVADNTLLELHSQRPQEVERLVVHGVRGRLLGINIRPADGRLYAVSDTYDLYTIDPTTGASEWVSTLTAAFDGGNRSGVDFNPQTDRLRLVGGNGQNLRVHAELGAAAADASVAYRAGDANFGRRPELAAAAYTRSLAGTPETQLFTIDSDLDVLALQDPPNDGALSTVGALGIDFSPLSGFDIVSDPGGGDHAFAASGSELYAVDLTSGAALSLGRIGTGTIEVLGLAVLDLDERPASQAPSRGGEREPRGSSASRPGA